MIAVFWLLLTLLLLPFGVGLCLVPVGNKVQVYLTGLCAEWGIYEILALLFHCMLWPLHIMTAMWMIICIGATGAGLYRNRAVLQESRKQLQTCLPHGGEALLTLFVVALVLGQALHATLSTYYNNWDDSTYCAIATTSWYTDTVNRYSPETGAPGWVLYGGQYVLAAWPVFSASLAQLTGIHPAIVFRTLLPLFEIPMAYGIWYLLARFFFPENRKKALWTLVMVTVVTLIAADKMPQNCAEWWLMVNPWSGKAIASNVMVPMILWILFQLEDAVGTAGQRIWWRSLFCACLASCLIAGTMFVLVPVELAIWGMFYLARTRRWKDSLYFFACGTFPLICLLIVYRGIILSALRVLF